MIVIILPDTGILFVCGIFRSIYSGDGGPLRYSFGYWEARNRSTEAGSRVEWGVRVWHSRSAKPGFLWATRRSSATITATMATHPYSSGITQPGSAPHPCPNARKCHSTYVRLTVTVQTMTTSVEAEVRNGSSQR